MTCAPTSAAGQAGKVGGASGGGMTGGSAGTLAGPGQGGTDGGSANSSSAPVGTGSGAESELGGADSGGTGAHSSGGASNGSGGNGGTSQGGETDMAGQTAAGGEAGSEPITTRKCGNGKLDATEVCDDGNTKSGDGCSASCSTESQFSCTPSAGATLCIPLSSCAGMVGNECSGADCCSSPQVTGGTVWLGDPDEVYASVSTFKLDKFEVTVGRFRRFVSAFNGWRATHPMVGEGQNPQLSDASGWQASFDTALAQNASALKSNVSCNADFQTWGDDPALDILPMNCVDWYEAFAFCIWDGGRLPTEAEWEYAAAGGSNNSTYPWGNTPDPNDSDATYAVYNCLGNGDVADCVLSDIQPVGSRAPGIGRYGQLDLAGSMWEWGLDWYANYPAAGPISNYANVDNGSGTHVIRGGDWYNRAHAYLRSGSRGSAADDWRTEVLGFRCARDF